MASPQKTKCPDCDTQFVPVEYPNPGICPSCGSSYTWEEGTGQDNKTYYIIQWNSQPQ